MGNKEIAQEHIDLLDSKERETISDGYHSFKELYDHRIVLYIALLRMTASITDSMIGDYTYKDDIWKSKLHSDGTGFEGWFILGIYKKPGEQITYHIPMGFWEDCGFATELEKAPEWDGHTSSDVLERLTRLY